MAIPQRPPVIMKSDTMIDFRKLTDLSYLLNASPGYEFKFQLPLLVIFGAFVVIGLVLTFLKKIDLQGVRAQLGSWFLRFGVLGLFLLFFRYEGIMYLSSRILLLLLMLGFLVWLIFILRTMRSAKPKQDEETLRQATYDKYLPRAKH